MNKIVRQYRLMRGSLIVKLERVGEGAYQTTITKDNGEGLSWVLRKTDFEAESNRQAIRKLSWWLNKHYPKEAIEHA